MTDVRCSYDLCMMYDLCNIDMLHDACGWFLAARCYASAAYVVMRCLCVCMCVRLWRSYILSKRINISSIFFSPRSSQTTLVFPYQTAWQYSDGNSPNRGVECRWGRQKSRFLAYNWLHCVMLTLLPTRCYQYGAARPQFRKLWHIAGSKRRSLLMAGKDGEMFMTRSFNVRPKTTEQHLDPIARSDKSVHCHNN